MLLEYRTLPVDLAEMVAVPFSPFERDEREQHRPAVRELKREMESRLDTIRPR